MPSLSLRIRVPSRRQMIVSPISRSRGAFQWSMAASAFITGKDGDWESARLARISHRLS